MNKTEFMQQAYLHYLIHHRKLAMDSLELAQAAEAVAISAGRTYDKIEEAEEE
jgi:hypothetical protein